MTVSTPEGLLHGPTKTQFQALADCIASRLLLNTKKELCNALKVHVVEDTSFLHSMLPEFGEAEVRLLCDDLNQ